MFVTGHAVIYLVEKVPAVMSMQLLFPVLWNQRLYLSHFNRDGAGLQMADLFLFFWYPMGLLLYTLETKPIHDHCKCSYVYSRQEGLVLWFL